MSADTVVIGVGSNLESPILHLRRALSEIKKITNLRVVNVSSLFESDAQLPTNAPTDWNKKFLNAAVLVKVTDQKPSQLLTELKKIEAFMGRKSSETWAPRTIDLDILYWDQLRVQEPHLQIPHPQLSARPFALLPLLQLLPKAEVERPFWASEWVAEKPFATVKSQNFFWPKLIGILNLTEDSFSDGGQFLNEDKLYLQIQKLIASKAEVLDFGAQSTRPGAKAVDLETELGRLKTALKLTENIKGPFEVSLDSFRPEIVEPCLQSFDINYINDVTGLQNPKMIDLVVASKKKCFVMHSLSVPPKLDEIIPEQVDPIHFLSSWWSEKKSELLRLGLTAEQLVFDPGIGFGKSKHQNLYILNHLGRLQSVQDDILIGHSRKSYQSLYSPRDAAQRDVETALSTSGLNMAYTQYLRVHDITAQTVAMRWK